MEATMNAGDSTSTFTIPSSPPSVHRGAGSNGSLMPPMSPALSFWSPSGARRRTGRIMKSTRINPEQYRESRTPWHLTPGGKSTLRRTKWTCLSLTSIGILSCAALLVTAWMSVPQHDYCIVLHDEFDGDSLDTSVWQHEVQLGGFGNGEFEMTTSDPANSFVEDGKLYIVPTLTNDTYGNDAVMNGAVLNFTADGTCTAKDDVNCVAFSNSTVGNYSILPPIRSARLTTKLTRSIAFGKVEVKARMPTGDWIWPAIWMLPRDEVYGSWPASGEIDIVESKGNIVKNSWDVTSNSIFSTLHWGLDTTTDKYSYTTAWKTLKRNYFNTRFYTYGLNWDHKGLRTWLSKPSRAVKDVKFNEPFFSRGKLGNVVVNGTVAVDPWVSLSNVTNAAPFDQEFYLILSLAVGGTNGWFADDGVKPWGNDAPHAARDFWLAREKWLPTWSSDPKERALVIESVKVWRLKEKGETSATCKKA